MTSKIGISRSNFISSRNEDFRVFSYVIWWTEYEKNTEKNHWRILDLENLQSRSHFIFRISKSWSWVFSASNYIPSKNLAYIRNKIWPWIGDFPGQGWLREFFYYFFHIQHMKQHRNTLSNLHDKWHKFCTLHFTLPAGLGWSIYRSTVRSRTLPEISSHFMYKFCIL